MLRCDSLSKEHINNYQQLAKENKELKQTVDDVVVKYLNNVTTDFSILSKSNLLTTPDDNSKTKTYLVPGGKVKVIQNSPDNKWVNIGYINEKGVPLVAWIKAGTVVK